MRHKRLGRKLGVTTKHRKSMLRNMVTDLFRHDRLKTTDTRAKELRRVADKMITLAKDGSLHKRRQAGAYIRDKVVLRKLFDEIAEKFKDRPGGYTRIIKLGFIKGDNSPISLIELVEEGYNPKKKKKKKAPAKVKRPNAAQEKVKSSKKESAEELGLIEGEEAKAAVAAETPDAEPQEGTEAQAKAAPEAEVEEIVEGAEETPEAKGDDGPEAKAEEPAAEEKSAEEASDTDKEKEKKDT